MISVINVSTLTPVLNEEQYLRDTVAALQDQDVEGSAEFIFVDGRSTDRTREMLEAFAVRDRRIRVLDNPAGHTASALNIGLRAARGEYVARVDAHTRYPPHYLSRGIERLRKGDVAWVAGPQLPDGSNRFSRRVALALGTSLGTGGSRRWDADRAGAAGESELATGVFTGLWRRDTLLAHGGWDEGWPINQDSELAARVLEAGGRIVSLPELAARYAPRTSMRSLARQYFRYGMYRAKTSLRHPEVVRPVHLAMPSLVVTAAGGVVGPKHFRVIARLAVAVYAVAIARQSARAAGGDARDAWALPGIFVIMHGSWGLGFLVGLLRFASPSTYRRRLAGDVADQKATED